MPWHGTTQGRPPEEGTPRSTMEPLPEQGAGQPLAGPDTGPFLPVGRYGELDYLGPQEMPPRGAGRLRTFGEGAPNRRVGSKRFAWSHPTVAARARDAS